MFFFFAKESIKELPVRPVRQSKNGNRRQMPNDRFFSFPLSNFKKFSRQRLEYVYEAHC